MISLTDSFGTVFSVSAESPARITDVAFASNLSDVSALPNSGNVAVAVAVPPLLSMLVQTSDRIVHHVAEGTHAVVVKWQAGGAEVER